VPVILKYALPALLTLLAVSAAYATEVIRIADGDTLTVLEGRKQVKIRLANIDAPERRQSYGSRSRQSLAALCFRKDATYEVQDIDRYGRTVAVVSCDGVNANRHQVEAGMAHVYTRYNQDRELPALQERAKAQRRGLWADDKDPVPPWEWRRSDR
jgi:micrococcal nuclease